MSDSGFPQFPAGPRGPEQASRQTRGPEPNARIQNLPNNLREIRQQTRLSGEVVQQNRDGSIRIRTERGNIDVQIRARETPPARGQTVEIQIPPGRPPTQLRVDVTPPQATQPSAGNPAPNKPQTSATQAPPLPQTSGAYASRATTTPLDLNVPQSLSLQNEAGQNIYTPPAQGQQTRPFPLNETIRIEPLTREQALTFITSPLETFFTKITDALSPLTLAPLDPLIVNTLQPSQILSVSDAPTPKAAPAPQAQLNAPIFEFLERQNPQINQPGIARTTTNNSVPFTKEPPLIAFLAQASEAFIQTPSLAPAIELNASITPANAAPTTLQAFSLTIPVAQSENTAPTLVRPEAFFNAQVTNIVAPDPIAPVIVDNPENPIQQAPQNLITQNQQAQQSVATLIAQTPQSLPIFATFPASYTDAFFFIAHAPADTLSIGAQIILNPDITTTTAPSTVTSQTVPLAPYFLTPDVWPTLNDIHQTLLQSAPQVAQAMSNMTPSPSNPAQMSNAMMFFVAAIRAGDLPGWMGQRALDALRDAGKSSSISRLGMEGDALSRLASEPVSQDWRALSIPMIWDNEIQKIALYYKHEGEHEGSKQRGERPTRFIFDLKLDQMGAVQLDGWYKDKRLDLIVRTERAFSKAAQLSMRALYADGLRETQITGELKFQNQPESWVKITPDEKNLGVSV